jgi:AraC-like DNA-binding protein
MTLARFLEFLEQMLLHRANLDDLVGFTASFQDLALPARHRMHDTPLCRLAKSQPATDHRCRHCKVAANRLAIRHQQPSPGTCYLGLSDWVLSVQLGGQAVAVLYLGSVRITEHLDRDRQRLLASCRKFELDADAALTAWEAIPALPWADFEKGKEAILALAEFLNGAMQNDGLGVLTFHPNVEAHLTGQYHHFPAHISRALAIMQKELDTPLRVESLSRRVGCSPGHFSRTFQKAVGLSFSDCLVRFRVTRGRQLLRRTNLQIAEIALLTGFADQTHFGRSFRKAYSMTPSEFRRQQA